MNKAPKRDLLVQEPGCNDAPGRSVPGRCAEGPVTKPGCDLGDPRNLVAPRRVLPGSPFQQLPIRKPRRGHARCQAGRQTGSGFAGRQVSNAETPGGPVLWADRGSGRIPHLRGS